MAYIKELIESLFDEQSEGNIESFKKLIYLAVNESKLFAAHALELANMVCPALHCIDDTTTKIYALQLLSELATNYREQIPPHTYDLGQVVTLLSDENAEVRKAAHYLLLIFIKKYERIDEIIKGYLTKLRESADQWKHIQKIIHSFQSLLIIEPKCVTYPQSYFHLDQFLRLVIACRVHQHALIQKASEQTVASFVKNEYTPTIIHKLDKAVSAELVLLADKLGVNLSVRGTQHQEEERHKVQSYQQNQLQLLLDSIQEQQDWKVKSDIIEDISRRLQAEPSPQVPPSLVDRILDLTYDYNFKICITAMNILLTLVMRYPQQSSTKLPKIEDIMVEKICDLKMAVRQIASKILRNVLATPGKDSAKKLLTKLSTCSVIGKEEILNFLQDHFSVVRPTDLPQLLGEIAAQLSNENTKIKIKTLDCLVKISLSCNTEQCKYILQKRLNKVYYDMFLDRLRERSAPEVREVRTEKWEDNKNIAVNKGLTWQAERSPNIIESVNDRFLTKIQFGRKAEHNVQQETASDFKYQPPMFGGLERREEGKGMMGTSHTSNDTFSTFQNRPDEVKMTKKIAENSKMNTFSAREVEEKIEEKRLPLKPKPVKKMIEQVPKQESNNLVIQSREYRNKNEEVKDNKQLKETIKQVKQCKQAKSTKQIVQGKEATPLKEERDKSIKKMRVRKDVQKSEKMIEKPPNQIQKSVKEPFSIKSSVSKKEKDYQIDYKATQYISKDELAPVSNPKEMLKEIMTNLPKDTDWSKQFDSLDGLRRLIRNHEEVYSAILQNLADIMPQVLKLVESLRSSLAKNGMITLAEMCQAFKKGMDPFLESIFVKLFRKAQDTNSFIIQQVNKCINSLCSYCSSPKIAAIIISNSQAKAAPIKLKVAFVMNHLFAKDNYSLSLLRDNPKILGVMGTYITDSSQEVRGLTRDIFVNLQNNNSAGQLEGMFRKSSKEVWDKWRSILDRNLK